MRNRLENFGQTRTRKSDCGEQEKKRVKRASSTTAETMQYLLKKANKDIELRKEELVVKKAGMADRQKIFRKLLRSTATASHILGTSQQKQQEQYNNMMQQQQQQQQQQLNIAMLTALQRFALSNP